MNRHARWQPAARWATVVAVAAGLIVPAQAAEAADTDIVAELNRHGALKKSAKVTPAAGRSNAIAATVNGSEITIPGDPSRALQVRNERAAIGISLPFSDKASNAKPVAAGAVAFENGNSSTTVPVVKEDGSVQILTVLGDAQAPTEYSYELDLPAGAALSLNEGGGVDILGADGAFLGGVAPAWAFDADGNAVPTEYEIDGSTVTQVVEHTGSDVTYPVTADPWLGIDLYYTPTVTQNTLTRHTINVQPTVWGGTYSGPEEVYMWWAHRDEVKTKLGSKVGKWSNTIQEQFYCHIAGFPASLPVYNMESWRPLVYWEQSLLYHGCNPS